MKVAAIDERADAPARDSERRVRVRVRKRAGWTCPPNALLGRHHCNEEKPATCQLCTRESQALPDIARRRMGVSSDHAVLAAPFADQLRVACAYALCSLLMTLANKFIFVSLAFPFGLFVALVHMAFGLLTVSFLITAECGAKTSTWSWREAALVAPLSFLFFANDVLYVSVKRTLVDLHLLAPACLLVLQAIDACLSSIACAGRSCRCRLCRCPCLAAFGG